MKPDTLLHSVSDDRVPARGPVAAEAAASIRPGILVRLVDPEWLVFEAFLFAPALVYALWGDAARATFFASLALHLGVLKWLGWAVLTRPSPCQRSFLMFPAEMVVGLTIVILWFYLRNVVGSLVPGSYSLVELWVAAWLVAISQVAGAVAIHSRLTKRPRASWSSLGSAWIRSCVYLPFVLSLTLTLWSVSKEVFVPSQDGWFHSFIARVFLNDGIFYRHFNGNDAIFYTSGFGGINAVTAAISGLTVVQVNNLQHILWIVTGLFLVTTTIAILAGRLLAPLHFAPPLFLSAYPVHNLPPAVYWTHTPQQTAAALLLAIPLVSLLMPLNRRSAFYLAMALQALLSLLVLALSPVCAFFLPVSCGAALLINSFRARTAFGEAVIKVAVIQVVFTLLAAVVVLGSDRFYSTLLTNPAGASYMKSSQFGSGESANRRLLSFSPQHGLAAAATVGPLELLPELHPASEKIPGRFLPWLALTLTVVACGLAVRRGPTAPDADRHLAIAAAIALSTCLAAKYGARFASGGITNPSLDALLLQEYLIFMCRRVELLLLFVAILAAVASLHVARRSRGQRQTVAVVSAIVPIALAIWWLPLADSHLDPRDGYLIPRNIGLAGRITQDDIELTHWMEENLPAGRGLIGVANIPFKIGDAKFLFPIDAAQALSLYGKHYNFCFQIFDPGRQYGYDDYTEHVVNYFDAEWSLRNGIRFFHVPRTDIFPNHGLARAREIGLLEPIRTVSSSAVYAVRSLPWKPIVVPGPSSHVSSNHVSWQPDGSGVAESDDPQIVFALKEPLFVHAIRFRYTLTNPANTAAAAQLFWSSGTQEFVESERTARLRLEATEAEQTLTILVHDTIDRFRFDPDANRCTFRIREIELLVKPFDTPGQ